MNLAIFQPVLIPDLHDLAVMKSADLLVIQDTEQWSRKGRTHRAVIRTPEGTAYIHVPVKTEDKKKPIREVRIDQEQEWVEPILKMLKFNYSNSVYYDFYEPEIRADLQRGISFKWLTEFSGYLKSRLFRYLELEEEIRCRAEYASGLECYSQDPDKLARTLGAKRYFQEHDARHYQRQGRNKEELPFRHPEYRQHFEGFEPYCCILDLLFQFGPESFQVLDEL